MAFVVLEAGPDAGAAVGEWAHVRLFSAWRELIDPAARRLLEAEAPGPHRTRTATQPAGSGARPTCEPLADLLDATTGGTVRYGARVVGVSRAGRDLLVDSGRESDPFAVHVQTATGHSGCWAARSWTPRAPGRSRTRSAPTATRRWANVRTPPASPTASPTSPTRPSPPGTPESTSPSPARAPRPKACSSAWPGSPARDVDGPGPGSPGCCVAPASATRSEAATTTSSRSAASSASRRRPPRAAAWSPTSPSSAPESVTTQADGRLTIGSVNGQRVTDVDEVIVVTGFRPDFGFLSEVRLDLDPALGAVRELADQVHPDHHSCGDVQPHGYKELSQPERTSTWSG